MALDPRRWVALGVIVMVTLMVVLDASVINIALPQAQRQLDIIDVDRHWVITAYAVTFGGLLLLGGRIADYAGRKRTMIVSLLGFAIVSAIGGLATTQWMLFAARALQGIFAAALAPAALALVSVTFTEPRERATAFGIYGAVSGAGGAIGLIVGGLLTEYGSWRWCMFVNVPIAMVTALAAVEFVRESRAAGPRRYDVVGALLASTGAAALVVTFTLAGMPGLGWTAPTTLLTFAAASIALAAFVSVEIRGRHPLVPLRIVADRNRGGTFLTAALIGAGMFGALLMLTFYLQVRLRYTPVQTGVAFLPFSAAIIASSMLSSWLLPRIGPKPLMVTGTLTAAAGMLLLTTLHQASTLALLLSGEVLVAIGVGLVFVPINSAALTGIDPDDAGIASALVNAAVQLGGALGVALLNTLYAGTVSAQLTISGTGPTTAVFAGYRAAFRTGSVLFIAAVMIAGFMLTRRKEMPL